MRTLRVRVKELTELAVHENEKQRMLFVLLESELLGFGKIWTRLPEQTTSTQVSLGVFSV